MPFRTTLILVFLAAVLVPPVLVARAHAQASNQPPEVMARDPERNLPPELQAKLKRPLSMEDCIAIAQAQNRLLAAAGFQRQAVETGVDAALGTWWPEFGVSALRTSIRGDTEGLGSSAPGVNVEATATDLVARVTQRLPLGGAMEARYDFAKSGDDLLGQYGGSLFLRQPVLRDAGWRRATAEVSDSRLAVTAEDAVWRARSLQLVFQVKSAYYEVLRRRELIEVSKQAIARDEQLLAFSQAKMDAQLATRRDVLSAEIILAQDRSRLVNAETDHKAALDDLANLLGVGFADPLDVVPVELDLAPIAVDEVACVGKALRDNPDVQAAATELQRSELSEHVAGSARMPRLDLTLLYGQIYDAIGNDSSFRNTRRSETTWQGGVEIALPFLNKTRGSAHEAAKLRLQRGEALLEEAQRQVVLQVRDATRNLQRIEDRISMLDKEIQGARDKVEFANVNFQLGRASNLDITDAQKDLVNAESDYVDEVVGYRVEVARLERLLGGALP